MTKAERIFQLAQQGADAYHMFKARRWGAGIPYIDEVMDHLKFLVMQEFGPTVINQFLSQENRQSVDFWLADEQTIVDMEFNVFSSPPILEREIIKALLAKDAGNDVQHLLLIGDPGAELLMKAPTPASIIRWAARCHNLEVQIRELKDQDDQDER